MNERLTEASRQPQLDSGTAARMEELGFDPQQICTGDIGSVMENASPEVKTDYGNVRAEVVAAFYAAGRDEELMKWWDNCRAHNFHQ